MEKLDKVLGGIILAAGVGVGLAATGSPALAPLKMFAAAWGWLEQKDAAVGLLRSAIGGLSGKLAGTRGQERRELIAAAHSVIVAAAFFEAFEEHVGKDIHDRLAITEREKETLFTGHGRSSGESVFDALYRADVPIPGPAYGFEENVARVILWQIELRTRLSAFLDGLSAMKGITIGWNAINHRAEERYRSYYLELAAKVPEFMIWALLNEATATRAAAADRHSDTAKRLEALHADGAALRSSVTALREDIEAALDVNREALGRVAALLALDAGPTGAALAQREALTRSHSGILAEKIVPEDAQRYEEINFPTVQGSYINPRYRLALAGTSRFNSDSERQRLTDEDWWDRQPSRNDFDLMLAAYVTAPEATHQPMLLLGHPGAGKSMLTKVFAARLPPTAYTVALVPLRRVGANAPIRTQIETALADATNGRVQSWWQLAEQSADTIRVVLLDGLDELLQASQVDRSGYLQEVAEFQRHESEQQRPVIVVVTSRTVVADRVDIPRGTTVVRLDMFEEPDIADWLAEWRRVNAAAIAARTVRELTVEAALRQRELAQQPLLLLMLALYVADPSSPGLEVGLATSDLYQRLLENFARREVVKARGPHLPREELDQRVQDHLDRLAIAALGMFNRGRQDISEAELGADLAALDEKLMERSRPTEAGQRIIGQFFFVHAPEARTLTGPDEARPAVPERAYEFLHATFGEYLVARRIMDELLEVTAKSFAGRRGPSEPDDALLYTLLSRQPLAVRQPTLSFASEIAGRLVGEERAHLFTVLEVLLSGYRNRQPGDPYAAYRPTSPDMVRQLACYSANLVALRVCLGGPKGVPVKQLLRSSADGMGQWYSTVMLWKTGLDPEGMQAMLDTVQLTVDPKSARATLYGSRGRLQPGSSANMEVLTARLAGDHSAERLLRYGMAAADGHTYAVAGQAWADTMSSWLIAEIAGRNVTLWNTEPPPKDTSSEDIAKVSDLIFAYLRSELADHKKDTALLQLIFDLPQFSDVDPLSLTIAVLADPSLMERIPALENIELYEPYGELVRHAQPLVEMPDIHLSTFSGDSVAVVNAILGRSLPGRRMRVPKDRPRKRRRRSD